MHFFFLPFFAISLITCLFYASRYFIFSKIYANCGRAALLDKNLSSRVNQTGNHDVQWNESARTYERADVTVHLTRGQVNSVTSSLAERLRGARCNQNYANTMQIPAHHDANPRHNIGGNWPTALSQSLFLSVSLAFFSCRSWNLRQSECPEIILEEVMRPNALQRFRLSIYAYLWRRPNRFMRFFTHM